MVVKIIMGIAFAILFVGLVGFKYLGHKSKIMDVNVGVQQGRLLTCEGLKNCMNSYETDGFSNIQVSENPMSEVKSVLESQGLSIVSSSDTYIHATASTKIFSFVDDIEFYYDGSELHYRSASRVGRSDLGANAERMHEILDRLNLDSAN